MTSEVNKTLLITAIITIAVAVSVFWLVVNKDNTLQVEQAHSRTNTRALQPGEKAPEFSITTIDGTKLTLADFRGKILVLTSGAAWCPTCIIENKNFLPVQQEFKDKGVEFMTVDIDPSDTPDAVREFQELYAPWHNVHVSSAGELINDYGFWRFEITYIIDGDGIVQFWDSGITSTVTLREELSKLI